MSAALKAGDLTAARAARSGLDQMTEAEFESQLIDDMAQFYDDPAGFVYYALTGATASLRTRGSGQMADRAAELRRRETQRGSGCNIREATASGHGIGKTAVTAWLSQWAMSTRPHLSGVVTANTMMPALYEDLARARGLAQAADQSALVQMVGHQILARTKSPRRGTSPRSRTRSTTHEAFAGWHSQYKIIIFDEASAIPDKIWEVTEGAMTDPRSMWFVFREPH